MKSMMGLLLAAGVLALFGCGEDSSSDSSLSRAAFNEKVNQLCKNEDEERTQAKAAKQEELGLEPGEIANAAQHKLIVEATAAPYEEMTERIQELVPSDLADEVAPLIEAREKVAEVVRKTGPPNASLAPIKKANELAMENGLDECSI
jgi:outer membrane murein-binding lipoprotein Lpp